MGGSAVARQCGVRGVSGGARSDDRAVTPVLAAPGQPARASREYPSGNVLFQCDPYECRREASQILVVDQLGQFRGVVGQSEFRRTVGCLLVEIRTELRPDLLCLATEDVRAHRSQFGVLLEPRAYRGSIAVRRVTKL